MKNIIIETKNPEFDKFINSHAANMLYYLDISTETDKNIDCSNSTDSTPFTIPINLDRGATYYSPITYNSLKIYDNFIFRLFERAHKRIERNISKSLLSYERKAEIYINPERSQLGLLYELDHIQMKIYFEELLNITFLLRRSNHTIFKKLVLEIDNKTNIIACYIENLENIEITKNIEKVILSNFNQKQLDYLILLTYYYKDRTSEFLEPYFNDILDQNYDNLNRYFDLIEMSFI